MVHLPYLFSRVKGGPPIVSRYYHSVRKLSDLLFCENLVDFYEARLHGATLNLHTHA